MTTQEQTQLPLAGATVEQATRPKNAPRSLFQAQIVVRVTHDPGHSFLDRMIALVEGAKRQKTPNEIALSILLAGLTLVAPVFGVARPAHAARFDQGCCDVTA